MGEDGETTHVDCGRKVPAVVALANSGYPEQSQFQVLRLLFRRICRNMNAELVGEIYRGGGGILRIEHPMLAPIVESYLAEVRAAGAELATAGRLSAETTETLDRQLIPTDIFIENVNRTWDKMMKKARSEAD